MKRKYSIKLAVLICLAADVAFGAESRAPMTVSDVKDGECIAVVSTNRFGDVVAKSFQLRTKIDGMLEAPIGSVYLPPAESMDELKAVKTEEILLHVPPSQTASASQYWKRPVAVLLKRDTHEVVGFFSVTKKFDDKASACKYLANDIALELTRHFGKEPKLIPCGNVEGYFRYDKDGKTRELRFKFYATDDAKSAIMIFHGYPRTDASMLNEFKAVYKFLKARE